MCLILIDTDSDSEHLTLIIISQGLRRTLYSALFRLVLRETDRSCYVFYVYAI